MPDAARGATLFGGLAQYPLPQKTGVVDYVFYFVPNDGFGAAARIFFQRFYPHHVSHEASSLEQMFTVIAADIAQGRTQQIRELVLVAHGTTNGLLIPLVATPVDPNLKFVTAYSVALLQTQLPQYANFTQKRAAALPKLSATSWVTVRACNFGQSRKGMYALYSLFGGNADVYCPIKYQFFGHQPIVEGSRYPDRLEVHEHLVKQGFLPKDRHTPDRADAVVRAIVDPGSFAEPFPLATAPIGQSEPADYAKLVDDLNAGRASAALIAAFAQHSFALHSDAQFHTGKKFAVAVDDVPDAAWFINDTVPHPAGHTSFPVLYNVGIAVDQIANTQTLTVQAQLVAAHSTSEQLPLELLLEARENDIFRGKLFTLASTADDDDPTSDSRTRFDAIRALLSDAASTPPMSGGGIDIAAEFAAAGSKVADTATIRQGTNVTPAGDNQPRISWTIGPAIDAASYLIKLEHPYSSEGVRQHVFYVYSNLDPAAAKAAQMEAVGYIGAEQDEPGVELAAFFDRFGCDGLIDMVAHLHAPYRPENSLYIWHALQAMRRKGNYIGWLTARFPLTDPSAGPLLWLDSHDLVDLTLGESDDLKSLVYAFEFDNNWAEAKASNVKPFAFHADLFAEEPLGARFGIDLNAVAEASVLDDDSPYTLVAEIRELESLGMNQFFEADDKGYGEQRLEYKVTCTDFRVVLEKFNTLSTGSIDQLVAGLRTSATSDGTQYLKILLDLKSKYSQFRNLTQLTELNDYLKLPKIPIPTDKYEIWKLSTKTLLGLVEGRRAAAALAWFKDATSSDFIITVPMKMVWHIWEEQAEGSAKAEAAGNLTALRRWLRFLAERTRDPDETLPEDMIIDIKVSLNGRKPYYLEAYDEEMNDPAGLIARFVYNAEELHTGFDRGADKAATLWLPIREAAVQVMNHLWFDSQTDACRLNALIDAGFLDQAEILRTVTRTFAQHLLDQVPHV